MRPELKHQVFEGLGEGSKPRISAVLNRAADHPKPSKSRRFHKNTSRGTHQSRRALAGVSGKAAQRIDGGAPEGAPVAPPPAGARLNLGGAGRPGFKPEQPRPAVLVMAPDLPTVSARALAVMEGRYAFA
ncbi:hypothetical protein OCOJLMKI_4200 [Methylobacterium iners]|uniref:Uncharacterized protein n=1 Tax=Methylobacterium iners TaxID=418707 RepID=A0ABQ4S5E7_9HYPH|nr:hypothetical protein OCOJLMKI_4200 [Methylobacterium iners]